MLDQIEARWQQVATYPFSAAPREDIAPGIRHLIVGEYLTLYRVVEEAIEIVRVLHGRRKIDAGSATDCVQRRLDRLPKLFHRLAADRQANEAGRNGISSF